MSNTGETDAIGDDNSDGDNETETGEPEIPWEPIPARGDINLASVVINQGVDVPITINGEWVGPADRNTFLVANRDTLLRGFWELPSDWVPRDIRAQLELRHPDGTSTFTNVVKTMEGPSFAGDLHRSFLFPLLAEQLPPGVQYHLTLWETGPGFEDQRESTTAIEAPIGGRQQIGIQPEPVELKVVLVPVRYQTGSCDTNTADITEAEEQRFLDFIHDQNPVQEVIWEFRRGAPIQWNTTLTSLAELWQPLQEMRIADAATPNTYYYALVSACANGVGGAGGIAPGLPPATKDAAYQRVSSGLWLNGGEYAYHTMVHELGHNQGFAHIFCAGGDAAGIDPSYPYEDGIIGVWGFGVRLHKLYSPTATRDYMSYCSPNWVSDWTWSKAYKRIRTLTAWDYEGAPADPPNPGEVLIGLLMKDGTERWWTTPGGHEPEYFAGAQTIEFDYRADGGEVIEQPVAISTLDDGTTMITAAVPRPGVKLGAATRLHGGEAHAIELPVDRAWSF